MKKEDFLKLFETVPADGDIRFIESCPEDVNYLSESELRLVKMFHSNTPVFIIAGKNQGISYVSGVEDEVAYQKRLNYEALFNDFPKNDPYWSITKGWSNGHFECVFTFAALKYVFRVNILKTGMSSYFGTSARTDFQTWEEFFENAKPVVRKWLQTQREELETLIEKPGILS